MLLTTVLKQVLWRNKVDIKEKGFEALSDKIVLVLTTPESVNYADLTSVRMCPKKGIDSRNFSFGSGFYLKTFQLLPISLPPCRMVNK